MVLQKLLRMGEGRRLKQLWKQVEEVNAHEADVAGLSDADLTARTDVFRARIADGEELDELMPEAFATVREAARRVLGQRPYDVQVLGGIVLHDGDIAEMRTGEGKTLTSTMPVYLNALSGKGVHVVTVNPYLASRDAEWMGRVHRFLGLTVGLVYSQQPKAGKREAYACDITYGTNNELGFDYLRDHMVLRKEEKVQRGHAYSIVDEVDSILVDDARTPLIISGPAEQATEWYQVFAKRVSPRLEIDEHYEVDEAKNTVAVTEEGVARVEELLGVGNLYESVNTPLIHHLQNALRAKELYRLDDEYIVEEGEVHIVDENTGRTLYGRRYSEGLHQAIEAKEGVTIKEENQTLATITLQNFFRLYDKLAGMTGTAKTEESEFAHIYNIGVVVVPTNEPIQRNDQADQIYKTGDAKLRAVVHDVVGRYEAGQPVLLGTVSVEKSETLSSLLQRAGVTHEVLNAKNHFREADIVAQAGRQGAVTVATNMAGRGVDIMLGGNPEALADEATRKELDVGSDGEIEDPELFQKTYLEHLERFQGQVKAEGDEIRSLGGLYVCATERHESRRIDNQLRGRSGRQGDPGESRFYLSLEDDLMRLFNASAVESIMNRLKLDDDVPIEAGMVSKAVERAQRQVESRNFEMRKNVLKYDDVMNSQRSVVYAQRTVVLEGRDEEVAEFAEDVVQSTIEQICATYAPEGQYPEDWPLDELFAALSERYDVGLDQEALRARIEAQDMTAQQLAEMALEDALDRYEERETELGSEVMRAVERRVLLSVVDRVWREHLYEMDHLRDGIGLRAVGQRDPLVEYQREAYDEFSAMMVRIREESTGYFFRLPVQRVEPAPEAEAPPAEVVKTAKADKKPEIVRPALRDDPPPQPTSHTAADGPVQPIADAAAGGRAVTEPEQAPAGAENGASGNGASGGSATDEAARSVGAPGAAASRGIGSAAAAASAAAANEGQVTSTKVGRNDPCPCGSGRKFKKCHGA